MSRDTLTTHALPTPSPTQRTVPHAHTESQSSLLAHVSYAEQVAISRGPQALPIPSSFHASYSSKQGATRDSPITSNGLGATTASRSPTRSSQPVLRSAVAIPDRSLPRSGPITAGPLGSTSAIVGHSPNRKANPYAYPPSPSSSAASPAPAGSSSTQSPRSTPASAAAAAARGYGDRALARELSYGPDAAGSAAAGQSSAGNRVAQSGRLRGPIHAGIEGRTSVSCVSSPTSSYSPAAVAGPAKSGQVLPNLSPRPPLRGPIRSRAYGSTTAAVDYSDAPLSSSSKGSASPLPPQSFPSPGVIRYAGPGATSASFIQQ